MLHAFIRHSAFLRIPFLFCLLACATPSPVLEEEAEHYPLSEEEEIKFGNYVDAVVTTRYPVLRDQALTRKVTAIGNRVVAVSERPDLPFTFRVLNTNEVNAFAGPGGFVYVTVGMLGRLKKKDELASVLAHEIGHVCERHAVRSWYTAHRVHKVLALIDLATMMAGYPPVAGAGGELMGDFDEAVDDLTGMIVYQGYDSDWERRADELALRYTARAGCDPHSLVNVLTRFSEMELKEAERKEVTVLSSHCPAEDRITHLTECLDQMEDW